VIFIAHRQKGLEIPNQFRDRHAAQHCSVRRLSTLEDWLDDQDTFFLPGILERSLQRL